MVVQDNMARIILENGITHVVHLATLLSGQFRPNRVAAAPPVCRTCLVLHQEVPYTQH